MANKGFENARLKRQEQIDNGTFIPTPPEHNLLKKAQADPKSRVKAVKAFCFYCVGGTIDTLPDSGYKGNIATCPALDCPLYNFRPYKKKVVKDVE